MPQTKKRGLPSRFQQLPEEIKQGFKESYFSTHPVWDGLKIILEEMLEDMVRESEKEEIFDKPGHYEHRINLEGQRRAVRKIISLIPTEGK